MNTNANPPALPAKDTSKPAEAKGRPRRPKKERPDRYTVKEFHAVEAAITATHKSDAMELLYDRFLDYLAAFPKEEVNRLLRRIFYGDFEASFSKLKMLLCQAFDKGELETPIAAVIVVRNDNRCKLALLNLSPLAHEVTLGRIARNAYFMCVRCLYRASDGFIKKVHGDYDLELSGYTERLPGRLSGTDGITCRVLDPFIYFDAQSIQDLQEHLIDIGIKLKIDGQEKNLRAHILFGAEAREGGEPFAEAP